MNRCETITLLDIPQDYVPPGDQDAPKPIPFTIADLQALLRRHRHRLARRTCALFRKAGWPVPRAELLRILAADEQETLRRILAVTSYVPEERRRVLDQDESSLSLLPPPAERTRP